MPLDEFVATYRFPREQAKLLMKGERTRLRGWCSTSKRAKRQRERFMTVLVNMKTNERFVLGRSVKAFAREHNLCFNELSKLVNGHKILYRGFCLAKTLNVAHSNLACSIF